MWLLMLLSRGFFDTRGFSSGHLRGLLSTQRWTDETSRIDETDIKNFVDLKVLELDRHDEVVIRLERKGHFGDITKEKFVNFARSILAEGFKTW